MCAVCLYASLIHSQQPSCTDSKIIIWINIIDKLIIIHVRLHVICFIRKSKTCKTNDGSHNQNTTMETLFLWATIKYCFHDSLLFSSIFTFVQPMGVHIFCVSVGCDCPSSFIVIADKTYRLHSVRVLCCMYRSHREKNSLAAGMTCFLIKELIDVCNKCYSNHLWL